MDTHQPIRPPGARLRGHVGLRWRRPRGGRKPLAASLTLTPLIDVFVVIVLFLLVRFNPAGELLCGCAPSYELPVAEHADRLSRAPIVGVGQDGAVTLDGAEMAQVHELLSDEIPDWKISKLTDQLEAKKHNWVMTNPDRTFSGTVIIAADQAMDVKALKKILYSCSLAGYTDTHLAVDLPEREE